MGIDVSGHGVIQGRDGVFVIPGQSPLLANGFSEEEFHVMAVTNSRPRRRATGRLSGDGDRVTSR